QDAALRAHQDQLTVVAADPLQAAHQHPEPGGVEEVDALEVDDDLVLALADQLDEPLAEARRGVDVDLTLDGQHGPTVAIGDVETEIHALPHSSLLLLGLLLWAYRRAVAGPPLP